MVFYSCSVCGTKAKNPECHKHSAISKINKEEATKKYMESEKGVESRNEANRRAYEKKHMIVKKNEHGSIISYGNTTANILAREVADLFKLRYARIDGKDGLKFYNRSRLDVIYRFIIYLLDANILSSITIGHARNIITPIEYLLTELDVINGFKNDPNATELTINNMNQKKAQIPHFQSSVERLCNPIRYGIENDIKSKINDVDCGFYVMLFRECFEAAHRCKYYPDTLEDD